MKGKLRLWNILVASILLFAALFGGSVPQSGLAAPLAIALSTTTAYTQNFDGIGNTATATLPVDWGVTKDSANVRTVGDFSTATFATERLGGDNMSTTAANGIYNYGAGNPATATDRAVGFLSSSSATKSGNLYAHFNNGTGSALYSVVISYNVEKYRKGSNAAGFSTQLYYSLNGTAWTSAGVNFQNNFTADADNTGYSPAPGVTQAVSNQVLAVSIPAGSDFYLAWNYSVTSGATTSNSQGLGIDDFSILGSDVPLPSDPSGVGAANPNKLFADDPTLLSVTVTPGANPVSTELSVICDLTDIGGSPDQSFLDDGLNGDVSAGDNIFSYSTTVGASTTFGAKSLGCTISDAEARSASAAIGLTVLEVIPIGAVNGPVLDTDDGTAHRSPYAPPSGNGAGAQLVTVQGVIYEKTLQAISGSTNTYKGFFIQNTAATADGDPHTSDGLFVFMSTFPDLIGGYVPTVGDEVVLSGKVTEYYNMTELTSATLVKPVVRSGVNIDTQVAPLVANPPANLADANRYWERMQGMRVQVPTYSIVLGGRNVFNPADAEVWVASPDSTIAQRINPYTQRAFRDAHPLDDNYDPAVWDGNGYRILMGSLGIKATEGDGQALITPARTFDQVTNSPAGGLNYTFNKYRIEISEQPTLNLGVDPALNNPPQAVDPSQGYTIADYNLENLYDYRNDPSSGCDFTGDTGCPAVYPFIGSVTSPFDYVPANDAAYQARLTDIATQIKDDLHSPDILMVQEVENQDICTVESAALVCGVIDNADGKPDVLQELALKIADLGGPAYDAAFDRDSSDLRGIVPAFLYRTDRVQLLPPSDTDPVLGSAPTVVYAGDPVPDNSQVSNPKTLNALLPSGVSKCETDWVFPRAPDIALFRVYDQDISGLSPQDVKITVRYQDVYVINNHFKSGPNSCTGHRTEQAKYNAAIVQAIETAKPNANVVVGGDLNVYPRPDDPFAPIGQASSSDQLAALYDSSLGLKNLWESVLNQAPTSAYSYVYLGMAQTLDQMFMNHAMLLNLHQVEIAHINSDFPADYPGDVARGTSDHDPTVATIYWASQELTADAGGPYRVNQGADVEVSASASDPTGGPVTYAWDLNNDGVYETSGQTVTYHAGFEAGNHPIAVEVTGGTGLTKIVSTNVFVNYRIIMPVVVR